MKFDGKQNWAIRRRRSRGEVSSGSSGSDIVWDIQRRLDELAEQSSEEEIRDDCWYAFQLARLGRSSGRSLASRRGLNLDGSDMVEANAVHVRGHAPGVEAAWDGDELYRQQLARLGLSPADVEDVA